MSVRARSISMSLSFAWRCRMIASADFDAGLGEGEVRLEAFGLGLVRRDLCIGRGEVRFLDIDLRAGLLKRRLRSDRTGIQFGLAFQVALRVDQLRLAAVALRLKIGCLRLGALERRARLVDLRALGIEVRLRLGEIGESRIPARLDLLRVKPGHHLAFFHRRVVVGEDLDHLAGELRADEHRGDGVERSRGPDAGRDRAAIHRCEAVGLIGRVAARRRPQQDACASGHEDKADQPQPSAPQRRTLCKTRNVMRGDCGRFPILLRVNSLSCAGQPAGWRSGCAGS